MLKNYIQSLGIETVRKDIQNHVVQYRMTEAIIDDAPILSYQFENTLHEVVFKSEELDKVPHDVWKNVFVLLDVLESIKTDLLLSHADYVCIFKGPFLILRVENLAKPNSGRSICVEMKDLFSRLDFSVSYKKDQSFAVVTESVLSFMFFGVAFYGAYTIYKNF
jgi:hypothetical protein